MDVADGHMSFQVEVNFVVCVVGVEKPIENLRKHPFIGSLWIGDKPHQTNCWGFGVPMIRIPVFFLQVG